MSDKTEEKTESTSAPDPADMYEYNGAYPCHSVAHNKSISSPYNILPASFGKFLKFVSNPAFVKELFEKHPDMSVIVFCNDHTVSGQIGAYFYFKTTADAVQMFGQYFARVNDFTTFHMMIVVRSPTEELENSKLLLGKSSATERNKPICTTNILTDKDILELNDLLTK